MSQDDKLEKLNANLDLSNQNNSIATVNTDNGENANVNPTNNTNNETNEQQNGTMKEGEIVINDKAKVYVPQHEVLTDLEKRLVFMALCLGMFLAALDQMIVIVALKTIVTDLNGLQYLSWVLSAYLLSSSATMPLYGKYSDIYGRRLVYMFCIIVFLIGSAACGLATNIWFLIGFRGFQGIGGGGLMSLSMVLIGDIVEPADRAKYMSAVSGIFGIATVVGPVLGGFFTDYISWRWIFYINLPFGAITLVVCWIVLKKIKNAQKDLAIDLLGSAYVCCAAICIVLVVTWGGDTYHWDSIIIILLSLGAVLFILLFIQQEMRHPEPILNVKLFKIRNFAVSCSVMFFFGMSMLGAFAYLPYYFQGVRGDSAIKSGFKLIPMVVGMMMCSMSVGIYVSKTGKFILFPTTGIAVLSVGEGLCALMGEKTSYGIEWVFIFIMGCGMGMCLPVYNSIVQNSVPPKDMASSVGGVGFLRSIGGSIGVAIIGSVFTQEQNHYYEKTGDFLYAETRAIQITFLSTLGPSIVAFLLAFGIKNVDIFARRPSKNLEQPMTTDNHEAVPVVEIP